ncbi:MAG TPA: PrgI family protein [Candidatus Saccharimonadales bacterium]|nr:PrgI family protein [Candidatus Saccharimonadales bacterium]
MRTINIPAQVTSVEDRIIGNLTLIQVGILVSPVFAAFAVYAVLPRPMHLNLYKLILIIIVSAILFSLAIRLKTKLILFWVLTLVRFRLRTKLFVFNKNTLAFRNVLCSELRNETEIPEPSIATPVNRQSFNQYLPGLRADHKQLSFIEERKGKLNVYINKAQ